METEMQIRKLPMFYQSENCLRKTYTDNEDFIFELQSRRETELHSAKRKPGELLSAKMSWWESIGEQGLVHQLDVLSTWSFLKLQF